MKSLQILPRRGRTLPTPLLSPAPALPFCASEEKFIRSNENSSPFVESVNFSFATTPALAPPSTLPPVYCLCLIGRGLKWERWDAADASMPQRHRKPSHCRGTPRINKRSGAVIKAQRPCSQEAPESDASGHGTEAPENQTPRPRKRLRTAASRRRSRTAAAGSRTIGRARGARAHHKALLLVSTAKRPRQRGVGQVRRSPPQNYLLFSSAGISGLSVQPIP